ncbi:MAG: ABC transporter ATP-binding protein [Gammaproteobacteria bacterium]|nr:ABC transporter ATP-binding protein [Gammaproteobacteria bacterium]
MSATAVNIAQVHKHFGAVHALKGIDFSIERGEFFGLLGPNGAGKSTLINIMAGLARADGGAIEVHGHDVVKHYRKSRMMLGVVPQELVYDPFFSVREMLRLQSGYFGFGRENHAWIDELISVLNLQDKALANLAQLSGGMKRRVLIAQALVHKPKVLVLDEPTAGVDVELRQALWEFSSRLHKQGTTIVLTTHYLEEAEALCGRIAIVDQGALVALDTTSVLLNRHPYRLLCLTTQDVNVQLPAALAAHVVAQEAHSLVLRLHRVDDPIGAVLDGLRSAGVQIQDIQLREPKLEDVFLHITGRGHA